MKYKICIKYPSGYRYHKVVEVDGEEAAQAVANRLLDRCNAGFGDLPACRIESIELVMPINERLQEIEERVNKATPGPWRVGNGTEETLYHGENSVFDGKMAIAERAIYPNSKEFNELVYANMRFIAHAREDLPYLLAEVKRLRDFAEKVKRDYTECDKLYIHIQELGSV